MNGSIWVNGSQLSIKGSFYQFLFFPKMLLWFVPDGISPLTIELPHKKLAQKNIMNGGMVNYVSKKMF